MELICPSCEARYELPGGSIGEKGRQVSCMNCGHSWHAYPPLVLGSSGAPSPGQSTGIKYQGAGAPAAAPMTNHVAPAAPAPAAPAAPAGPTPVAAVGAAAAGAGAAIGAAASSSRSEQLAEIRQMLAEVQSEDRAAAAIAPEGERTQVHPGASAMPGSKEAEAQHMRIAEERAAAQQAALMPEEDADSLHDRMERHEERNQAKPVDMKKIRKRHDRKLRQKKHAASAGSGAFLTGFLLIAIIAAVMIALYVLAPQISAQFPQMAGPLNEYVATMDELRVNVARTWSDMIGWVSEKLDGKV